MIETILSLSTAHLPSPDPDFGGLRFMEHEYGFFVFVAECEQEPEWLKPIVGLALELKCVGVLFDRDADESKRFTLYRW